MAFKKILYSLPVGNLFRCTKKLADWVMKLDEESRIFNRGEDLTVGDCNIDVVGYWFERRAAFKGDECKFMIAICLIMRLCMSF